MQKNIRYTLIPSRDIDKRIINSDWLRAFWAITEEPYFSETSAFQSDKEHCNEPF